MINKWYLHRMIDIIPTYPQDIHQERVFQKIGAQLREEGKEIPRTLDNTVRGVYNANCEGYKVFEKRRDQDPCIQPIFKTKNPRSGFWSKHPDYIHKMLSLDDF